MALLGFTLPPDSGEKLSLGEYKTKVYHENEEIHAKIRDERWAKNKSCYHDSTDYESTD